MNKIRYPPEKHRTYMFSFAAAIAFLWTVIGNTTEAGVWAAAMAIIFLIPYEQGAE